jgi:hypothetical protein
MLITPSINLILLENIEKNLDSNQNIIEDYKFTLDMLPGTLPIYPIAD